MCHVFARTINWLRDRFDTQRTAPLGPSVTKGPSATAIGSMPSAGRGRPDASQGAQQPRHGHRNGRPFCVGCADLNATGSSTMTFIRAAMCRRLLGRHAGTHTSRSMWRSRWRAPPEAPDHRLPRRRALSEVENCGRYSQASRTRRPPIGALVDRRRESHRAPTSGVTFRPRPSRRACSATCNVLRTTSVQPEAVRRSS